MASVSAVLRFTQLTDSSVTKIRKTSDNPPRVSVIDTIALITGHSATVCSHTLQHLKEAYPDVGSMISNFKFNGQGQRETPIANATGIVTICMLLPGQSAARFRKAAADVLVRYLGGDLSLVEEIAQNHLRQDDIEEDDPGRLFGQVVESEALKRKREEVEMIQLECVAKRARVQSATDIARLTLLTMTELNLPISDRDRMLAKDIITTAAFTEEGGGTTSTDRDVCLQMFCAQNGKPGKHISLGKRAKALYLAEHPDFVFPKKDIFTKGQMVKANRWVESQRSYLERAIADI
jgi:hypothetical protein